MATLTIRNLSEDTVERLKVAAEASGRSMEQEVRDLLESRYGPRSEIIKRIQARWDQSPEVAAADVEGWRTTGRP